MKAVCEVSKAPELKIKQFCNESAEREKQLLSNYF